MKDVGIHVFLRVRDVKYVTNTMYEIFFRRLQTDNDSTDYRKYKPLLSIKKINQLL